MSISFRLPDDVERRLYKLCEKTGRMPSFYITQALHEHLEEMYWAHKRLAGIRCGAAKIVILEHMIKKYGLED